MQRLNRHDTKKLGYSIASAAGFVLLVSWTIYSKWGLVYFLYALPIAYLTTLVVLVPFVASSRKSFRLLLLLLAGAGLITGASVALTASHGYPLAYNYPANSGSCTTVKVQNASSPYGYTNSTACTSAATTTTSVGNLVLNYLYWLPVSGLVLYAVPPYREKQSVSEMTGQAIFGMILLAALLLPLTGLLPMAGS